MTTLTEKLHAAHQQLHDGHIREAIDALNALHVESHTEAGVHIRTHIALARAHRSLGNYRRAAFELVAIPFAGPASLVHKYLGLSRKLQD